ncbi:MAG: putative sugar O-methyltransferase [Polyangiaceae bacterium]|nr:putative sugar O-methyltransferase [Polyangiaceae bacterium]
MKHVRRYGRRLLNFADSIAEAAKPSLGPFGWLLHRAPSGPPPELVRSKAPARVDDVSLIRRVMASYKRSFNEHSPSESFWDRGIVTLNAEVHHALMGTDVERAGQLLRNPAASTFFWGFDAIAKAPPGSVEPHESVIRSLSPFANWQRLYAIWLIDSLSSVAEAMGARRVPYLETPPRQVGAHEKALRTVDDIVDQIDGALGMKLTFPNPFPGELGLRSRRGVIGFRAIQAVYQAWRIAQIAAGKPGFKVMEIGAGLGRTAYFANVFGLQHYTIIDIPLTNAAQGYFLGRVLGPDAVRLNGEDTSERLAVLPAAAIERSTDVYDLIVNVDSWTEMSPKVAEAYWNFAKSAGRAVLSINHEHNLHTVSSLYSRSPGVRATRFPYWPRRGYVEEFITW